MLYFHAKEFDMNRVDRLMGIVTTLQSKKHLSAEAIAQRFEISVRTVYRDIRALDEIGVPVGFEPGQGYFVMQGYFLPPVIFSNEEANALSLMEPLVMRFADQGIRRHYAAALNKVKAVLKSAQKDKMEHMHESVQALRPRCLENDYDYLAKIQTAIVSKNILRLQYENAAQEASYREVEPIGLIFYSLNWHLIGWCWKREEYRDFRVSRIQKLASTTESFRKCDHIALSEYQVDVYKW